MANLQLSFSVTQDTPPHLAFCHFQQCQRHLWGANLQGLEGRGEGHHIHHLGDHREDLKIYHLVMTKQFAMENGP